MYWASWNEYQCPHCKTHNMLCHGDLNDCTGYDPTNCKCYSCNKIFEIGDDLDRMYQDNDPSDFDVGYPVPRSISNVPKLC